MNRVLKGLMPAFLKRLDHWLMTNRPQIWATRIHILGFWGSIALVLSYLLATNHQLELADLPDPVIHFILLLVPAFMALFAWAWQVKHFQPEDQFADRKDPDRHLVPLIYITGVVLLLAIPSLYGYVLQKRMGNVMSKSELAETT